MSKPKTILFGPLPPPYGGVSVFMSRLRRHVSARNVRIWAYTGDRNGKDVTFISHRRLGHIRLLLQSGRNARITDSTHFHLEHPHWLLVPLWLTLKRLLGFTWVKVLHDGTLPGRVDQFSPMKRRLFRSAIRAVDEFVPVSRDLADWLVDVMKVNIKVDHISALLPLDDSENNRDLTDTDSYVMVRQVRTHKYLVCSVGHFSPEYGFAQVADACDALRKTNGWDIGLLLADGLSICDPEYRDDILRRRDWVYVAQNVPFDHMQALYKTCDAFVRGFAKEGYGLARIEALWSGVPVIAARSTEECGMFSYDFGDTTTLTRHLENVLNGSRISDAEHWASVFARDADSNLQRHLSSLAGNPEPAPKINFDSH